MQEGDSSYWDTVDGNLRKFVSANHSDVVDWTMQHVPSPEKLKCECLCHVVRYRDYPILLVKKSRSTKPDF